MEFSSKRQVATPGVKQAVLAEVYDLGEVETPFGVKDRCRFIYEINECRTGTNVPLIVMADYNKAWSKRSNLFKDVTSIVGRPLTSTEQLKFNAHSLIGVNCLLTVVHRESKGVVYANIANISPIMPGMELMEVSEHYTPYAEVVRQREQRAAEIAAETNRGNSPYVIE